jgi:hypothetical protein
MHRPKRLAATLAAAAMLAAAVPAAASAAPPAVAPSLPSTANICLHGVFDPGPLGPLGPYGAYGPYGKYGPLHGQPNPLGNVASCGGTITYILRGGTLQSFIQATLPAH